MRRAVALVALLAALSSACGEAKAKLGTGDFGSACEVWAEAMRFREPRATHRGELQRWAAGVDRVLGRVDLRKNLGQDKTAPSAGLRRNLAVADTTIAAFRADLRDADTDAELRVAAAAFARSKWSAAANSVTAELEKVCR